MKNEEKEGELVSSFSTPRSYVVRKDDGGIVRRNRRHLVHLHRCEVRGVKRSTSPQPQPVPKFVVSTTNDSNANLRINSRANKGKTSKFADYVTD